MSATLGELAAQFDCDLHGDSDVRINAVGTLTRATANQVSFLANPAYRQQLANTHAGAVILEARYREDCPVASLVTDNPYAAYARIAQSLSPSAAPVAGIHPSSSVAPDAVIDGSAQICAQAVVESGAEIGAGVVIGPGSVVGPDAKVGEGTRLAPKVVLMNRVEVGSRCLLHSGVVIGADGFGFARDSGSWVKVPQLGGVTIGTDVEIGANTTVDRGAIENTVIEDGVKLDNQIQIAHNARVGAHTVMAAFSGIAGSTTVGERCMFGGAVVAVGHLTICDDAVFTFGSRILKSVTEPGVYSGTLPVQDAKVWRRNAARFAKLDESLRSIGKRSDESEDR